MDRNELSAALAGLPLGGLRFFSSIGSTNDEALAWAGQDAQDMSLVVADEQTAGRGRAGRTWVTPPGTALAFSLIIRPTTFERAVPGRIAGLGALALVDVCRQLGMQAQIKWPNDVLLRGRKVAGILVETVWAGNALQAAVLGMGINVLDAAVPPAGQLTFAATSLQGELAGAPERVAVLSATLTALFAWRLEIASPAFMDAWESSLAFRGQRVAVTQDGTHSLIGTLLGLDTDANLRVEADNMPTIVHFGEIHLRPMDDKIG